MSPILLDLHPDGSAVFTATVVISGIVIVVGVLLLLIFIFQLFGKIVSGAEAKAKKKNNSAENKNEKIPMPKIPAPKPAPVVEEGISGEVVAAIAAAVAMSEGPQAVVRSIKRKDVSSRNPWAQAAQINNTKPF